MAHRELSDPERTAIEREEAAREQDAGIRERRLEELRILRRALCDVRYFKPHFYAAVRAVFDCGGFEVRQGEKGPRLEPAVHHGFYSVMGRKLGLTPNSVRYRVRQGLDYLMQRAAAHARPSSRRR
jgi:hypothetical protein